ncbi:Putative hypothetical protein [Helicobacter mustelae 12198]|uniref:Uncharacterized protein n=1 Tax=Helicobacter mustelae (strain ATCC 43772 / CCUG 25715 / CIP 103759 / LMG 18044 / NCTC 12198 / R85-136P) TaxID=679897 RepID=D3UI69_HELM1|nr:Putative hypothetical protein [Helicobacter mustelae 12198]
MEENRDSLRVCTIDIQLSLRFLRKIARHYSILCAKSSSRNLKIYPICCRVLEGFIKASNTK